MENEKKRWERFEERRKEMENVDKNAFGKRFKEIRLEKGMSLQDLAEATETSHTELYRLESGARTPRNTKLIKKLADALDIPYEELGDIARMQVRMKDNVREVHVTATDEQSDAIGEIAECIVHSGISGKDLAIIIALVEAIAETKG